MSGHRCLNGDCSTGLISSSGPAAAADGFVRMGANPLGVDRGTRLSGHGGGATPRGGPPPAPLELEFRGRTAELARLRMGLRSLAAGVPARALVLGEQGIGKSRLIAEALSPDAVAGLVLRTGRAVELHADRPFGALIDALDLRTNAAHSEAAAVARLMAGALRRSGDAEQREDVVSRIVALVARLTDTAPIALVLEDVQWADRFTVMTLARLSIECDSRPLGLFLTRRVLPLSAPVTELLENPLISFDLIDLDALDPEVIALLAHEFLGAAPGPRLQQQIDACGGNPALLLALLNGWRRAGVLHPHGDTIETGTAVAPPEMRPAVLARIERLTPRCQDLLTVAAVFERPFGVATLAAIARSSVIDVLSDLREGLAARLLIEVAGLLNFQQQLVREILYEATPATVRAELHRQIAEALRAAHGSPEVVGYHQLRAAELSRDGGAAYWPADASERTALRWELLTPTEREVALLVSRGLRNKQAGARLQISARTVETHLAHVFAKLGINSRVELASAVGRAGIGRPDANGLIARDATPSADLTGRPQVEQRHNSLPM